MTKANYAQICSEILKSLSQKQKEVISRRFALDGGKRETLESIGKEFGITRERVRQIERDAFLSLKSKLKNLTSINGNKNKGEKEAFISCQKILKSFRGRLKDTGNLRREDRLLQELGEGKFKNEIYFLLTLGQEFERLGETKEFYPLWTTDRKSWDFVQKTIGLIVNQFKKTGKPLGLEELKKTDSSMKSQKDLVFFLEISKKIQKNSEGLFGLKDWPEINPRTIKDKTYLVFKKTQKPLHFTQVASLIDSASRAIARGKEENKFSLTLPQTVHNELIKDQRFVLVGRGIYALKEWGYEQGMVKDVIRNVLKTAGRPLSREEVLEKTLKQRMIKENTVFLNLSNKKYFLKNSEGYYIIREA